MNSAFGPVGFIFLNLSPSLCPGTTCIPMFGVTICYNDMFPVTQIHPAAMSFLRLRLPPNCEVAKVGNPSENQLETKHGRSFGPL